MLLIVGFSFRCLSAFIARLTEHELLRFVTCVKEDFLNIQLTRMIYIPEHSRDHADSKYVSYIGIDHKGAKFISSRHTETQLFILV